jgi:hypothetical protein
LRIIKLRYSSDLDILAAIQINGFMNDWYNFGKMILRSKIKFNSSIRLFYTIVLLKQLNNNLNNNTQIICEEKILK